MFPTKATQSFEGALGAGGLKLMTKGSKKLSVYKEGSLIGSAVFVVHKCSKQVREVRSTEGEDKFNTSGVKTKSKSFK